MRTIVFGIIAALALAAGPVTAAFAADAATMPHKKSRLIVQVSDNDPAKWNLALNNARNVQKDLGAANVDIEIVAYGPGIGMVKADSVVANRVSDALASGVKVLACENTMQGQKIAKADMMSNVSYISSGVVEIMQKQQEGWAYLRP